MTMQDISPHKSKGRPRIFDRDAALRSALDLFWRRGYEPASIAELCSSMGINPPSLYAAFGSKAQLFMEAVNCYEAEYWDSVWDSMALTPDFLDAMEIFFRDAAKILGGGDAPCGCLVILAATNVSAGADEVDKALQALRKEGRDLLLRRVKKAIDDGQLPKNTDAKGLSLTLNTILEGMSLAVRDGASRRDLDRVAKLAMQLVRGVASQQDTKQA
ncbi:MAG: TetR/AcrR family transcriptional regulator [Devosia sp.]